MKTKATHKFLALPIIAAALITGSATNAATVFSADFNATTLAGFGAQLTATNLDAGTATGSWTVNQAQAAPAGGTVRMIQGASGNVNATNKALRFGIDFAGTTNLNTPILTANLTSTLSVASGAITVSFDQGTVSGDGGAARATFLTGRDASNNRLFQISFNGSKQLTFVSSAGTNTLIGAANDLLGNNNAVWNATLMKTITIDISASTYDIKLNNVAVTGGTGLAFRDVAATGLSKLEFSANNRFTGSAFDNIIVSQIPEPSAALLGGIGFLVLLRRRR